jgi:pilus assembly protein Flp/PilA
MKNLTSKLRRFLADESGPTAVEYAVMLALILVACITVVSTLGTNVSKTFSTVGSGVGS